MNEILKRYISDFNDNIEILFDDYEHVSVEENGEFFILKIISDSYHIFDVNRFQYIRLFPEKIRFIPKYDGIEAQLYFKK